MIIDTVQAIHRYAALGPNYAKAAAFLQQTDLSALCPGKIEIDGDNVFANLADLYLERTEMAWESHRKYTDIQVILQGEEKFGWVERAEFGPLEGDFQRCTPLDIPFVFILQAGQFVLYFPGEPHAPGNPAAVPGLCRKLVIKVLHQD